MGLARYNLVCYIKTALRIGEFNGLFPTWPQLAKSGAFFQCITKLQVAIFV